MSYELVQRGGIGDYNLFQNAEERIDEGQKMKIVFQLRFGLPDWGIGELNNQLSMQGVTEGYAEEDGQNINVYARKGFPFLAVILAIILAIAIIAILIIGWEIYREIESAIPPELKGVFGWAIAAIAVVAGVMVVKSQFKGK